MATTKDFQEYVLEQFADLEGIVCRPMMGEYLLYYNSILFGGIYDNRVLVKIVESNSHFQMGKEIPYEGAKPMYMIDSLEHKENLYEIVVATCKDLKPKEKKRIK